MSPAIPETLSALRVPVASLVPYGANPRHGDVDGIATSLEVNGQYRPIVVRSGTNEVLAGNHTLLAARQLGWTDIAATFVECDEEQAKRIVLVDNRSNDVADYDDSALVDLLQSLEDGLLGTGYDQDALDALIAGTVELPLCWMTLTRCQNLRPSRSRRAATSGCSVLTGSSVVIAATSPTSRR